jgi:hypothetical protein
MAVVGRIKTRKRKRYQDRDDGTAMDRRLRLANKI